MNVYVIELSKRLAAQGIAVDVFTRAHQLRARPGRPGVRRVTVHHARGAVRGLTRASCPGSCAAFAARCSAPRPRSPGPLRRRALPLLALRPGWALARDRWGVPLVHTMHTMAKVKNEAARRGDSPEPLARTIGEEQVVEAADMLVANTDLEAKQLINLYDADPGRLEVVHPGVDLSVFRPHDKRAVRAELGLPPDAAVPSSPVASSRSGARRAAARGGRAAPPAPVAALGWWS